MSALIKGRWSEGQRDGAVVSNSRDDSGPIDEDTVKHYGGYPIGESINARMRKLLCAVPQIFDVIESLVLERERLVALGDLHLSLFVAAACAAWVKAGGADVAPSTETQALDLLRELWRRRGAGELTVEFQFTGQDNYDDHEGLIRSIQDFLASTTTTTRDT